MIWLAAALALIFPDFSLSYLFDTLLDQSQLLFISNQLKKVQSEQLVDPVFFGIRFQASLLEFLVTKYPDTTRDSIILRLSQLLTSNRGNPLIFFADR
jgi:hypothetical protein